MVGEKIEEREKQESQEAIDGNDLEFKDIDSEIEAEKNKFNEEVSQLEDIIEITNVIDKYRKTLTGFYKDRTAGSRLNSAVHNFGFNFGNPASIFDDLVRDKAMELYGEQREILQKKDKRLEDLINRAKDLNNLLDVFEIVGGIQEGKKFYYADELEEIIKGYIEGGISEKEIPKACGLREKIVRMFKRGSEAKGERRGLTIAEQNEAIKFFDERVLTFSKYKDWRAEGSLSGKYDKNARAFLEAEFVDETVADKDFLAGSEKKIKLVWEFLERSIPFKIEDFERRLSGKDKSEMMNNFDEREQKILAKLGEIADDYIKNAESIFDFSLYPEDKVKELIKIQSMFHLIKEMKRKDVFIGREKEIADFIIYKK